MRILDRAITFYLTIPLFFLLLYTMIVLCIFSHDLSYLSPCVSLMIGLFVWNRYFTPRLKNISCQRNLCEYKNNIVIKCSASSEIEPEEIIINSKRGKLSLPQSSVRYEKNELIIALDWEFISAHKKSLKEIFGREGTKTHIVLTLIDAKGFKINSSKMVLVRAMADKIVDMVDGTSGMCDLTSCVQKRAYKFYEDNANIDSETNWYRAEKIIKSECIRPYETKIIYSIK